MTKDLSTSNTDERGPYVEEVAADRAPDFKIRSGELFLYTPPGMKSPLQPFVTAGYLKDKTRCLHFRLYRRNGNEFTITRDGVSFKLSEFEQIVGRVRKFIESEGTR
jgi:hypothetical protein